MIKAMMFDLDGTLVQSEKLKAMSYAMAVQRLRGLPEPDPLAIEAYREVVGSTRDAASQHIWEKLGLDADLSPLMGQYKVSTSREALTAMRTAIYNEMVSDPAVLRDNQWPYTVGLLRMVRENHCCTALATMSQREEAMHVIRSLDLEKEQDVVLTRDDVRCAKPDPEIYLTAARKLEVAPGECLVLEDSPVGVRAGVAAGMNVIAMATPFTIAGLHKEQVLDDAWIVHRPEELLEVVRRRLEEHGRTTH